MDMQRTPIISALGTALLVAVLAANGLHGATDGPSDPVTGPDAPTGAQDRDALAELAAGLQDTDGFLGLRHAGDAVQALFAGPAPTDLPDAVGPLRLDVLDGLELERGRVQIDEVVDLATTRMAPTPAPATGIGPGSHLIITIPGEGTFGCTANFVWEEGSTLYLGAAGHCFLPEDEISTHNVSSPYDASGVDVEVCVSDCHFGGQMGFIFTGHLEELGTVAYARQSGPGGDVGNDFGIVAIPSALHHLVRTQMPVWGGPNSEGSINGLAVALHYGAGVGFGETYLTQARAGMSLFNAGSDWFAMEAAASPGDSGSAVNTAALSTSNVFVGDQAGGVLTHLVGGFEIVAGTQVPQAKSMASGDAGINISVKV